MNSDATWWTSGPHLCSLLLMTTGELRLLCEDDQTFNVSELSEHT